MHHKLLLGSSALVSVGVLLASTVPASAQMEVRLSGFTEFGMNFDEESDNLTGTDNRGYGAFMDTEINVLADAVSDSGVEYGGKVELEVFGVDRTANPELSSGAGADEAVIFMSGAFGRVELGREDGAEDVMFVGGEDVAAGTGGFDGDTTNLIPLQIQDTSDAAKITYFTPRIAGFQLGASFTPDTGDDFGDETGGDFENSFGVGANWTGEFTGLEMTVAAVGHFAEPEDDVGDDIQDWGVGFNTELAGIAVGAAYNQRMEANEADIFNAGLGYGFGPVNASLGYVYHDPDAGTDAHLIAVSGDVGILPGVVLKGDVTYNTDTVVGEDDDTGNDITDGSFAAVATIQLNY